MNTKNKRNLLMASLMAVPVCQRQEGESDWFPAVDLTETGQEYVFEVDLPGLKPEDIQVRASNGGFSISGRRRPRSEGGKHLRIERPSGEFVRRLPLPEDAEGEIHATFTDGVLVLRVPRGPRGNQSEKPQPAAYQHEEVLAA